MNARLASVVRRRQALVARASAQRADFTALAARWRGTLAVADAAYRVGLAVRWHPVISTVVLALLVRSRQHRMLAWSGRLFTLWELYRAYREQWPRSTQRDDN